MDAIQATRALVEIAQGMGETRDVTEALRRICRALAAFTGAETVSVYLLDDARQLLLPAAAYRVPKEALPTLATAPLPLLEQGFWDTVFEQRQMAWSDDIQHDARFDYPLFRQFSHQSGAVIPLLADEGCVGGFYLVWWSRRRVFTAEEMAILEAVGQQVSLLLKIVRLYQESERATARYRQLFERNLAAIFQTHVDGRMIDCNEAFVKLLGFGSKAEAMAVDARAIYADPHDREALILGRLAPGRALMNLELSWRRIDGSLIAVLVNVQQNHDGTLEGVAIDISDRSRAEQVERAAAELRAIAALASAAAHEINNPLTAVAGSAHLLAAEHPELSRRIEPIRLAAQRIAEIVRHMQRITRVETSQLPSASPMMDIRRSSGDPPARA